MRCWLGPLSLLLLFSGGCTQMIAERLLSPMQPAERAQWLAEERRQIGQRVGDRLQALDYKSYDGTRLAALMILPRGPASRGVIVVLHGLTDSKEAMLDVAESFADVGYLAVAPDLRAHGSSGGRYTSLGYREKWDMICMLNALQEQGYDVSRTGVMGASMGAATALQWAGVDPRIQAVIAVAAFAELRSELDHLYRAHKVDWLKAMVVEASAQHEAQFQIKDVSPIESIRQITTPILLAHGVNDDIVPVNESRRLFKAARGPVAYQEADAKHTDIRCALGDDFLIRCVEWMNAYVPDDATRFPPQWVTSVPSRNLVEMPERVVARDPAPGTTVQQ